MSNNTQRLTSFDTFVTILLGFPRIADSLVFGLGVQVTFELESELLPRGAAEANHHG